MPPNPPINPRKILVVTSHGGHFDVAIAVLPAFQDMRVELVSYRVGDKLSDAELAAHSISRMHRISIWGKRANFGLLVSFLANFFEAFWILLRFRPHVIFSTGAEIAIPVALVGKFLFRAKLIHLETAVHPRTLSLTGKLLGPLCDRFFVQWPEAVAATRGKAVFAGRVF